jgi:16S rRNA (guanine966-N2)-methyltransferase
MAVRGRAKEGRIRIIGGQWRGRKLPFTATTGLRPTPDRVRETLFNWLAADIGAARCLDLFAGSGALGLEALSRGAGHCTFVDAAASSTDNISAQLHKLECQQGTVVRMDALRWLQQAAPDSLDIVFMDPPFGHNLLTPGCSVLEQRGLLRPGARIYLEAASGEEPAVVPDSWTLRSDKQAGEVRYRLFVRAR